MDKSNEKHFGLRVDGDILAKFRYVSEYEGRSANSQIIQLMLKFIAEYEKEHGKIVLDDKN
ncbi:MAG: Arc family DNA-binding protein [Ruminococcaceae bacterium]|nr:Arc family DNA-binding protein [Oscillospiraceae bacterium]